MEIYYKNSGGLNYYEVKIGPRYEAVVRDNFFRIKMLQENMLRGLICPVELEEDGVLYLRYEAASLCSLDRLFLEHKPNGATLKILASQIAAILNELPEYLILADDMVLKADCMLIDRQGGGLYMLCVPGYSVNIKSQFKQFLEYLMKIFDYRDVEGIGYLYGLYNIVSDYASGIEQIIEFALSPDSIGSMLMLEKREPEGETAVLFDADKYNVGENAITSMEKKDFARALPSGDSGHDRIKKPYSGHLSTLILETLFIMAAMAVVLVKYLFHGHGERDLFVLICLFVVLAAELVVNIMFKEEKNL